MENSKVNHSDSLLMSLVKLVATLRGKNGCPWDKKQTPSSVSVYLVEEVFELAEAIETGDPAEICEELGDVLFHIVFIARMFQEAGKFDLHDVAEAITDKMIRRHPHVFGDREVSGSEEVTENWHKIKLSEKKSSQKSSFDSVPASLPSLMRAYRISDRAAKSGIEWAEIAEECRHPDKMQARLEGALQQQDEDQRSRQFGQLLFALVNICRREKIHPETALAGTIHRFERKVRKMQDLMADGGKEANDLTPLQKAEIWHSLDDD